MGKPIEVFLKKSTANMISIHNNGTVPMELSDCFFEKYKTSGKTGGTGLGTYSARLMAETQRGSISMRSSAKEGTFVTISLPIE